jgi:hypothetical protein
MMPKISPPKRPGMSRFEALTPTRPDREILKRGLPTQMNQGPRPKRCTGVWWTKCQMRMPIQRSPGFMEIHSVKGSLGRLFHSLRTTFWDVDFNLQG